MVQVGLGRSGYEQDQACLTGSRMSPMGEVRDILKSSAEDGGIEHMVRRMLMYGLRQKGFVEKAVPLRGLTGGPRSGSDAWRQLASSEDRRKTYWNSDGNE